MMSRRRAPSALRRPISRVRSDTTISMMFMITMPPTTSDSETMPISSTNAFCEKSRHSSISVSDVNRPKLSSSFGLNLRVLRIAVRASSIVSCRRDGSDGRMVRLSERREPSIFCAAPSGMTTNSSCESPNTEPFFSLTPTTRKCCRLIMTT